MEQFTRKHSGNVIAEILDVQRVQTEVVQAVISEANPVMRLAAMKDLIQLRDAEENEAIEEMEREAQQYAKEHTPGYQFNLLQQKTAMAATITA